MKIGITYTGSEEKQQYYHDWLAAAGLPDLELVTVDHKLDNPVVSELSGLVLTGGIDIDPFMYGMEAGYENAPGAFNRQRDLFEKDLFTQALARKVPVLAICRGMQLVNVICGGTLRQDLGTNGNETHRAAPADKSHDLVPERGTLLMEILTNDNAGNNESASLQTVRADLNSAAPAADINPAQNISLKVNSAHHQVIDRTGEELHVSCYSGDGVPEAMEWNDHPERAFMLCVQWHPERMFRFNLDGSPGALNIRNRFIDEVKKYNGLQ